MRKLFDLILAQIDQRLITTVVEVTTIDEECIFYAADQDNMESDLNTIAGKLVNGAAIIVSSRDVKQCLYDGYIDELGDLLDMVNKTPISALKMRINKVTGRYAADIEYFVC